MPSTIEIVTSWLSEIPTKAPELAIAADTELIDAGLIDSIEILNLVSFLEARFGLSVPVEEFVPENFRTAHSIADLVTRLGGSAAAGEGL